MSSCHSRIGDFEFSQSDIEEVCRRGGLLSMEVEFSLRCNFRCPYCYVSDNAFLQHELTREEICDAIIQAKDLGARKIIILGGEPMVYPYTMEMIKFIRGHNLEVEMFTNGSNITDYVAKELFDYKVNVVLKMNTFDKDLQDMLTGVKGSYKIIQDALVNLKQAGYPSGDSFLAVSTIICRLNIEELPKMWQWLRNQHIVPYFEMITPQGRAKENEWLYVDSQRVHELFLEIQEIDREKYGCIWEPQPPLVGNKCLRHKFSCLLTSQGYVKPCVGVDIPLGNIRQQKLKEIISESEVIKDLRNHKATIKGPCRSCEKVDSCYGCRGAAYQLTGDYLASDPLCWRNTERKDQIRYLPTQVKDLISQKSPMRIVDRLLEIGDRRAKVEARISYDMPFVSKEGLLDEASYLELMAQAIAALHGFKEVGKSKSSAEGFLLGAKNLKILGRAYVGDVLIVSVFKYAHYGEFGIVKASIERSKDLIAEGEIKIWHKDLKEALSITGTVGV